VSDQHVGTLRGLRVVEIGTSVAAPMAAQILGDLGAEVIKVERVGNGDDSRSWAPPHWHGVSVTYLSLNRNKRSLALDFKDERGREILDSLVRSSDILIQNLRPGALASLGMDAESLRALNPRLIYCEMTGFGPQGPRASQPAYDPLVQAYSGIVSLTGDAGAPPARVPVSLLDMGTGMWAALAIYEALRRRDQTGVGSHVEVSLLQTALTWLSMPLMSVLAGNPAPERLGSGLAGVVPYGAFPTKDGHIFISAGNNDLWSKLCMALDAAELRDHPDFGSNGDRVRRRAEVNDAVGRFTALQTSQVLLERLTTARVPCAPVHTLDQVVADEQVLATGLLTQVHEGVDDDLTVVNLPATFDGHYPSVSASPPALGEDTAGILGELGLSAEDIADLVEAGVVGLPNDQQKNEEPQP
jgi:crotonobetainyl-CoA:carnitine CoA-transferase CaiB-like acyl-CoA transferase